MIDDRARCPRCLIKERLCVCALVPRVVARTPLVIARHVAERKRPGATARFAEAAIAGTRLVEHGAEGVPTVMPPLGEGAWLLFPGGGPLPAPTDVKTLVVVDGTWHQARRMVQRVPGVAGLPRLSLPAPPEGAVRPRKSRRADGMSTLEAIAAAYAWLEGDAVAEPLRWLHGQVVERLRVGSRGLKPGDRDAGRPTEADLLATVCPF